MKKFLEGCKILVIDFKEWWNFFQKTDSKGDGEKVMVS